MLNEPQYKDLNVFKEVTAAHVSVIFLLLGCIIPIFLCCGVMTENPQCVYLFISMEVFHLILFSAWEIYFIVHYMDEKNREELKKIKDEDYFWVPPLISILLEIYFLWVAYSYYRALLDYYYDYYPAVFYY
ncbi:uncharacterized protein LOC124365215 isoform X2 [Homalodisca vitripennis]|nr:uncharacterized protein LOC124365215 isoform X2 [Homalodisca vitripennis]